MKYKQMPLILSLALAAQLITPALALNISTAGNSSTAIVPATIQATTLSVTVPTQLPVTVDSDGGHTYATDTKITNGSSGPIVVSNIAMTTQNGWSLASYSTDMAKEPVGTKKLGFNINGSTTQQGEFNLVGVKSNFGAIVAGGNQPIDYSAVLPTQSEALDKLTAAQVIFTVDWYTGGNSTAESEQGLLALDKETIQMLPGTKESISVTYQETPSIIQLMALEDEIQWSSSNTSIAKVDSGVVEAQSTGNAVITAKAGDLIASCNVIVNEPWVPITAVGFSKHSTTIVNGSNETVLLLYNPEKFSGTTDLAVTSSDSTVASVTPTQLDGVTAENGPTAIQIRGLKAGKAVITATATTGDGTVSDAITVNITEPLKGIEVTGDTTVKVGETIQLRANKIPANTTDNGVITWSSSDTSIATVDSNGVVTGVAVGNVSITASCGGIQSTYSVGAKPVGATHEVSRGYMATALSKLTGNIVFRDSKEGIPAGTPNDVSVARDNSVIAYIDGQNAIVQADGGVLAPVKIENFFKETFTSYGYQAKSFDLRGLDTSKSTSTSGMFYNCSNLVSVNISNLDTSNITDMGNMFSGCESLESVDLSGINTTNVNNMGGMFSNCKSLREIDLSGMSTSKLTYTSSMFKGCTSLKSITFGKFDTKRVTDMGMMFMGCTAMEELDLRALSTDTVTNMYAMFKDCTALNTLDLSSFNTNKVDSTQLMFENCNALHTVYARDQEDADRLNASSRKPDTFTVTVKAV